MELQFQRVSGADRPAVVAAYSLAHWQIFGEHATPTISEIHEVEKCDTEVYVLQGDEQPIAIASLRVAGPQLEADECDLVYLAVRPEYHGQGIGAYMLRQMEARTRELGVSKMRTYPTDNSKNFYTRHGYTAISSKVTWVSRDVSATGNDTPPLPRTYEAASPESALGAVVMQLYQAESTVRLSYDLLMQATQGVDAVVEEIDALFYDGPAASGQLGILDWQPGFDIHRERAEHALLEAVQSLASYRKAIMD